MNNFFTGSVLGLILAIPFSQASANTHCSTADGTATYLQTHYMGGPAPPPNFEVGRMEWKLSGRTLLRSISCTPGESNPPTEDKGSPGGIHPCSPDQIIEDADLVAGFMPNSEVVIYVSPPTEPWHRTRKYLSKIEMYRPSRAALPNGLLRFEEFVICTESVAYLP